jgi:hypothetical protein
MMFKINNLLKMCKIKLTKEVKIVLLEKSAMRKAILLLHNM